MILCFMTKAFQKKSTPLTDWFRLQDDAKDACRRFPFFWIFNRKEVSMMVLDLVTSKSKLVPRILPARKSIIYQQLFFRYFSPPTDVWTITSAGRQQVLVLWFWSDWLEEVWPFRLLCLIWCTRDIYERRASQAKGQEMRSFFPVVFCLLLSKHITYRSHHIGS